MAQHLLSTYQNFLTAWWKNHLRFLDLQSSPSLDVQSPPNQSPVWHSVLIFSHALSRLPHRSSPITYRLSPCCNGGTWSTFARLAVAADSHAGMRHRSVSPRRHIGTKIERRPELQLNEGGSRLIRTRLAFILAMHSGAGFPYVFARIDLSQLS